MASAIQVVRDDVARLESGDVTPSIETLQRLAHAGVIEVHIEQERTYVLELARA